MLRAKAVRARTAGVPWRERALAATDTVGSLAGIPVVAQLVNAVNRTAAGRALLEKTLGVDRTAPLPQYHARRRLAARSEEHTSELQSQSNLVCRLLLEKKNTQVHRLRIAVTAYT